MAENRGKKFEGVIREAFENVPDTSVIRLPDPTSGYLGIRNISDFVIYNYPYQYFIECKSVHGNTLSIHSNDPKERYGLITNNQWEGMLEMSKIYGVVAGVICWWVDKDVTMFMPIQYLQACREAGDKSVRYDCIGFESEDKQIFNIEITGKKKRVFFDYDMTQFFEEVKSSSLYC